MSQTATNLSRRRFLQSTAGVTAGVIGVGHRRFTLSARAFGVGPIGTGIAGTSYLVRTVQDITGGESVEPGSSTPEAVAESWFRTAMYGKEHDDATFPILWNRLEDARTIAYVRAKSAVLEAINNGESEQFTMDLAREKVDEHYTTVQTNFLNHWKVQVNKHKTYQQEVADHSEMDPPENYVNLYMDTHHAPSSRPIQFPTHSVTLADGSTMEIDGMKAVVEWSTTDGDHSEVTSFRPDGASFEKNHTFDRQTGGDPQIRFEIPSKSITTSWYRLHIDSPTDMSGVIDPGSKSWDELPGADLNQIGVLWDRIIEQHSAMIDEVETWTQNAYGSVQAGETTVANLVAADPYVLAQEWATSYEDTGHLAYAAADLAVMGLSFDSENKMIFELDDGTTLEGTLYTSDDDFSADVGSEIDPAARSDSFYIAADTSTMSRTLPSGEFRESIDGGEAKLTVGAVEDTQYTISTSHGETVTVAWDSWSIEDTVANDGVEMVKNADSVVIDLSDELDEPVTSIESITHQYLGDEAALVMQVTDPFTILEAYNVETGEPVDVVEGNGGYNAGTSSVDLSWTDSYLEMRDDTDDYATASSGGGGGGGLLDGWNGFDWSWIPSPLGWTGAAAGPIKLLIVAGLAYLGYDEFVAEDDDGRAR